MIVVYEKTGDGQYPEFSLDGSVLNIGEQQIDIEELQTENISVKDIFQGQNYLANIFIPSPRFVKTEEGETEKEPVRLDAVKIILWKSEEKRIEI